jgi:hypothetical protein
MTDTTEASFPCTKSTLRDTFAPDAGYTCIDAECAIAIASTEKKYYHPEWHCQVREHGGDRPYFGLSCLVRRKATTVSSSFLADSSLRKISISCADSFFCPKRASACAKR